MPPVKLLFSAISGYGFYYLKTLLDEVPHEKAVVVGVIDPLPEKSGHLPWIQAQGIPVFDTIEEFFDHGLEADLTVISSPLQYHVPQAISAMLHGSHILVDKPVGVTSEEVGVMINVQHTTGRWVEVGYQWSYSKAIQALKRDILSGRFGHLIRGKAICLWPRDYAYYKRNNWAGRICDDGGNIVFDSPANNACAHFLHNLLFLSGNTLNSSGLPKKVRGQLFRAYDIENFDTLITRIITTDNIELLFIASHVTKKSQEPTFQLEFEDAIVRFGNQDTGIVAIQKGDIIHNYGAPDETHQFQKLFHSIEALNTPLQAICPPEAALSQTHCIEALQRLPEGIKTFDEQLIVKDSERRWVNGLWEALIRAYDNFTSKIEY